MRINIAIYAFYEFNSYIKNDTILAKHSNEESIVMPMPECVALCNQIRNEKNTEQKAELIQQLDKEIQRVPKEDHLKFKIYFYIGAGLREEAEKLVPLSDSNQDDQKKSDNPLNLCDRTLISFYVMGGYDDIVSPAQYPDHMSEIVYGYVLGGFHEKAQACTQQSDGTPIIPIISSIAAAYALIGNHEQVNYYVLLGASLQEVEESYRKAGDEKAAQFERLHKISTNTDFTLKEFHQTIKELPPGTDLRLRVRALYNTIVRETKGGFISPSNTIVINEFTKWLTQNPAATPVSLQDVMNELDSQLAKKPRLSHPVTIAICAVIGAAIGFVIGAIIGAVATAWGGGFGAFFTALLAAKQGVAIGAGIGAGIGGASGGLGYYKFFSHPHSKAIVSNDVWDNMNALRALPPTKNFKS